MIELKNLSAGYGGRDVLRGVTLSFPPGRVLALLGPNGCGKSTLLHTALGLNPKSGGQVLMDGTPIESLSPRERALKAAYLSQTRSTPNITAYKMVLHGRFPHLSYPRRYTRRDYEAADRALDWADAADVAPRPMGELSGGQRQKVYLDGLRETLKEAVPDGMARAAVFSILFDTCLENGWPLSNEWLDGLLGGLKEELP